MMSFDTTNAELKFDVNIVVKDKIIDFINFMLFMKY